MRPRQIFRAGEQQIVDDNLLVDVLLGEQEFSHPLKKSGNAIISSTNKKTGIHHRPGFAFPLKCDVMTTQVHGDIFFAQIKKLDVDVGPRDDIALVQTQAFQNQFHLSIDATQEFGTEKVARSFQIDSLSVNAE